MKKNSTVVRSFDIDSKQAALYFDYVIPFLPEVKIKDHNIDINVQPGHPTVLPKELGKQAIEELYKLRVSSLDLLLPAIQGEDFPKIEKERMKYWKAAIAYCQKYKLMHTPALLTNSDKIRGSKNQSQDLAAILADIHLVDVADVSWESIVEFRKDEQSKRSFRALIRFLKDQHIESNPEKIKDDLLHHLDTYQETAKSWRFETKASSLSMLLNSKLLLPSGILSFVCNSLGAPIEAIIGAAGGVAVEIGKISLHVVKRHYGFEDLRRDSPAAYLISAQEIEQKAPK